MNNERKNIRQINSSRLLLLPLLLVLLFGMFLTVIQSQKEQRTKTRAAAEQNCTVTPEQLTINAAEQKAFDRINQYRQLHNIPPLTISLTLKRAAAWMSQDMLSHTSLRHIDSLGRDINPRLKDCGQEFPVVTAELIDSGTANPDELISSWEHAPSQASRLLDKSYTQVGVALATGSATTNAYWAVVLVGPEVPTTTPKPSSAPSVTVQPTVKISVAPTVKPTSSPTLKPTAKVPTPTPTKGVPIPTKVPPPPATPTAFPTIDPKFIQNPDDTQIYVTVKVPGIGPEGNRTPKHQTRRVQITISSTENKEIKVGTADLRFNGDVFQGNVHMGKLPNDIYSIKVSGVRTLKNVVEPQFQRISNDRLNVLPPVVLRQGDVSEDNALTLLDYNLSLLCFQDKQCKVDAIEFIDFNDDGKADVIDYNLLLRSFSKFTGD